MRVAATAGIVGNEFWQCTLDEIETAHRGIADAWRVQRVATFQLIAASSKMKAGLKPEDIYSLPYDENQGEANLSWIEDFYNNAIKEFPDA